MKDLSHKWEKIVAKVHLLIEKNNKLEADLAQMNTQNVNLKKELQNLLNEKEDLNKKLNITKLAKGVGLSEEERTEVKKQIKHYIHEIDDCLAKINA